MVETIHTDLAAADLLPAEHLVDQGYVDTELLLTSQTAHGVAFDRPDPRRPELAGCRGPWLRPD